jgi:PTH1 family peptidyl-tRNA hydrolase
MAWLVAGLGNPGDRYAHTRHNAGRMVVGALAETHQARLRKVRFLPAEAAQIRLGAEQVWIASSTRFMNESGSSYASFAAKHDIGPDHVIAVHDELEVPLGELMVKFAGGSGGHNGVKSLTQALRSADFLRVRIGIGRPPGRQDPADFVLQPVGKDTAIDLSVSVGRAADAIEVLVADGLDVAQQRFNRGAGTA